MTNQTYAVQPTQYYLDAVAAEQAGGAMINLAGGTLVVGDGGYPNAPTMSALIAANGVTSQVWSGQVITSVAVDENVASQIDITAEIPATINGVEIGPFNITEFAVLDALGNCCLVGTTSLEKTVSAQGQTADLIFMISVGVGVGSVILEPGSGLYTTMAQVAAAYDANLPSCTSPLTQTDTMQSSGWLWRVFGIQFAGQPAGASSAQEKVAIGAGRAATAAEFAAGAAEAGAAIAFPWPTLQQVAGALAGLQTWVTNLLGNYLPLSAGSGKPLTGVLYAQKGAVCGIRGVSASTAFQTSDLGGVVEMSGVGTVYTVPAAATVAPGIVRLVNTFNANAATVSCATAALRVPGGALVASFTIPAGGVCEIFSDGAHWVVLGLSSNGLLQSVQSTSQSFSIGAVTYAQQLTDVATSDASISDGETVAILASGNYVVAYDGYIQVTAGSGGAVYWAAVALYINNAPEADVANQVMNATAGQVSDHALTGSEVVALTAGDTLAIGVTVFGAGVSAASLVSANIALVRIP